MSSCWCYQWETTKLCQETKLDSSKSHYSILARRKKRTTANITWLACYMLCCTFCAKISGSKQILLISLCAHGDARTPQVTTENSNKLIWNTSWTAFSLNTVDNWPSSKNGIMLMFFLIIICRPLHKFDIWWRVFSPYAEGQIGTASTLWQMLAYLIHTH